MTTKVEVYNPKTKKYITVGEVNPTDPPGSFSNVDDEGNSEIILFECARDNSKTTITRSKQGATIEQGSVRILMDDASKSENVRELTDGQTHTMNIRPRIHTAHSKIRFTHNAKK